MRELRLFAMSPRQKLCALELLLGHRRDQARYLGTKIAGEFFDRHRGVFHHVMQERRDNDLFGEVVPHEQYRDVNRVNDVRHLGAFALLVSMGCLLYTSRCV